MVSIEPILRLVRVGRFGTALSALEEAKPPSQLRIVTDVLRAVLLEHVGEHREALVLTTSLLKSKHLTIRQRNECETVVGKILFDDGDE